MTRIAFFASAFVQRIKNGQVERQAELAARNDRDARAGWRLQAEIPRRCFDDAVSNRLRVPLVAGGDQTASAKFSRSGSGDLQSDRDRVNEGLFLGGEAPAACENQQGSRIGRA